ncbi:MAG TPA: hypothetical protein VKH63_06370 [Candidatus Acidoferrum sp.]|nr:hypothetical protein [Candidatus Acidoferrum sp.]
MASSIQTAQGINNSLGTLYKLLAAGYLSPRRAAVLAFINSLQLRTLSAIDADHEAGITDPTAPVELETTPADDTPDTTSTDAPPVATTATDTSTQTAPTWDPSIPEPDPTKKPS